MLKRHDKKLGRRLSSALLGLALAAAVAAVPTQSVKAEENPSEILLGAFWESDANVSNAVYWSTDGVNFFELATAYKDTTPNDDKSMHMEIKLDKDKGDYGQSTTLHDCSILYAELPKYTDEANTKLGTEKVGTYLMLSGFQSGTGDGERFIPMIGYSHDLVEWAYPASGSSSNVTLSQKPIGEDKYKSAWDSVAPDFFVDENGDIWITACFGYYANFHNDDSLNDIMQPYLIKVEELSLKYEEDTKNNPGASLKAVYSKAVPINLPDYHKIDYDYSVNNRIDSAFYQEDGVYYMVIKKDGVTDEIWKFIGSEFTLDTVQKAENWQIICEDAVTGFEGPCLTKYNGKYYLYTDKLKEYGDNPDGKAEIYVNVASTATTGKLDEYTGWLEKNQFKVHTYNADGKEVGNRHGTVVTVTDKNAIAQIMALKDKASAGLKAAVEKAETPALAKMGWYQMESYNANRYAMADHCFWYENDVKQGVRLKADGTHDKSYRGKEIYDPDTDGWYWLDNVPYNTEQSKGKDPQILKSDIGLMAISKDVLLPVDTTSYLKDEAAYGKYEEHPERWKWARYDQFGKMLKGQVHMQDSDGEWQYWWFDLQSGAMQKGFAEIWEVRDKEVPLTDRNGNKMKDKDGNEAKKVEWYPVDKDGKALPIVKDPNSGADVYDYNNENAVKKLVYFDETFGTMVINKEIIIGDYLYHFDPSGIAVTGWYPVQENKDRDGNPVEGWYEDGVDGANDVVIRDANKERMMYYYENGRRLGYKPNDPSYRGKELCYTQDGTDGWYWLDSQLMGAKKCSGDAYQDSWAGEYGDYILKDAEGNLLNSQSSPEEVEAALKAGGKVEDPEQVAAADPDNRFGKWVTYDQWGKMIKGWDWGSIDKYKINKYFDQITGAMVKGDNIEIPRINQNGEELGTELWDFDKVTGIGTFKKFTAK